MESFDLFPHDDPSRRESDSDARFLRWRWLAARRFGWRVAAPTRHDAPDRLRFDFHRLLPWKHPSRSDKTLPWHQPDWLRRIADEEDRP